MSRKVELNRVSATRLQPLEVPGGWDHEEDESPWVRTDATNDYVQPLNATGGGGSAAFVAADEPGHAPSGYPGDVSGHGNAASCANDPGFNEGDTYHPYSASWEGYKATGWRTRAVRELLICIKVIRSDSPEMSWSKLRGYAIARYE